MKDRLYLDTGALVKLYVEEEHTLEVIKLVQEARTLSLNLLQETELITALWAQHGRGNLSALTVNKILNDFNSDIDAFRLIRIAIDWDEAWESAKKLSCSYTAETLARTLDILHVAIAKQLQAKEFVTGDKRQAEIAKRAQLNVFELG